MRICTKLGGKRERKRRAGIPRAKATPFYTSKSGARERKGRFIWSRVRGAYWPAVSRRPLRLMVAALKRARNLVLAGRQIALLANEVAFNGKLSAQIANSVRLCTCAGKFKRGKKGSSSTKTVALLKGISSWITNDREKRPRFYSRVNYKRRITALNKAWRCI